MKTLKLFAILVLTFILAKGYAQKSVAVSVVIVDNSNDTPIPFASLQVKVFTRKVIYGNLANVTENYKSFQTDSLGFLQFSLPIGEYSFEASALNYTKNVRFFALKENKTISLALYPKTNQLDEVAVTSRNAKRSISDLNTGLVKLSTQNLKKMPVVLGEPDIIKGLSLQPGVSTVGEGAGGFNVRGGRVDQNLVLLDNAPLFNTSHLLGMFTSINPEAVSNVSLYKAGIPAAYGGRLASLLSMQTKFADDSTRYAIGAGPVAANFFVQNPIYSSKIQSIVSARVAYPNIVLGSLPRAYRGSKAFFYDINLGLQYKITSKQTLKLSAYNSWDTFKFPEDTSYFWGNNLLSLSHIIAPRKNLTLVTNVNQSSYNFGNIGLSESLGFVYKSTLKHQEVKSTLTYLLDKQTLEVSANFIYYSLSPGEIKPEKNSSINSLKLGLENARMWALSFSDEIELAKFLSVQVGLRYSSFQNVSGGTRNIYKAGTSINLLNQIGLETLTKGKNNANYETFEPRAVVNFKLSTNNSIKVSYNKHAQYLHLISNTTAISPVDFWKLSNQYLKPQTGQQFTLGYYMVLPNSQWQFTVETYYNTMHRLLDYRDGAQLVLNSALETELLPTKAWSEGLELGVQKNKGRLTGFLSYTASKVRQQSISDYPEDQINGGNEYASINDRPHIFNSLVQYYLGNGWTFSKNFTFQSGRPITYPDAGFSYNSTSLLAYSLRNQDRLPNFHRLDIAFSHDSRSKPTQRKYHVLNFSVYNLYARKNAYSVYYKQYLNIERSYRLAVLGTFVPSLTLNLYW
jgi:hypothetical protein